MTGVGPANDPVSVGRRAAALLDRAEHLLGSYGRRSDTAESTPEAIDVSDGSLARRIVEEEQLRLAEPGVDRVHGTTDVISYRNIRVKEL